MDITKRLVEQLDFLTGNQVVFFIFSLVLVVLGFWLLIKGADVFVEGASHIAEKARVPLIVIGLTIVAFGTSAPEAAISITSAAQGSAGIAVGNVVGSNILNVLLILGFTALFSRLPVKQETFRCEIPFVVVCSVILLVLGIIGNTLDRIDGLIFAGLFLLFMVYLFRLAKQAPKEELDVSVLADRHSMPVLLLFVLLGLILIIFGSDMTVYAASNIARTFGVSDRIIGLTIVAFGTSLPELVTSVSAARKGQTDIAIGNIIGSNLFNILFVLGISALVAPNGIAFSSQFILDTIVSIAAPILLWLFVLKNKALSRKSGIVMMLLYAVYFIFLLLKP